MKKRNLKIEFIIILILSIITIRFSLARYAFEKQTDNVIQGATFYFSSDLLTDDINNIPEYDIYNYEEGTQIKFNLKNYIDENRYSNTDIVYKVAVTGMEVFEDSLLYNQTTKSEKEVTINLENITFTDDKAQILIKVTSTSPFEKQLQAIFNIYKSEEKAVSYDVIDAVNNVYAKLIINSNNKENIKIKWDNNKVMPDATSDFVNGDETNTITLNNVSNKEQIVLLFYKKDITQNYSSDSNTIWIE